MPVLDLTPEELLTTTRSVRKRLDFSRPVEPEVIRQCLQLAVQAPTGANSQGWHFVVVTDQEQRQALGAIYRKGYWFYRHQTASAHPLRECGEGGDGPAQCGMHKEGNVGYSLCLAGSNPHMSVAIVAHKWGASPLLRVVFHRAVFDAQVRPTKNQPLSKGDAL
jgi:nitroreductase